MNRTKVQVSSDRNIIVIEKTDDNLVNKSNNNNDNLLGNKRGNNLKNESYNNNLTNISNNLNITPISVKKLNFKKKDFVSKQRVSYVSGKAVRNMIVTSLDLITFNLYNSIEAGPSVIPKRKYCDITGLETNYYDSKTKMRYLNKDIYKIIQSFPESTISQYLSIRKANFVLK